MSFNLSIHKKKLILLTGGARCGLDFLHHNLNSSSLLKLNGLNLFRTIYHLKKHKNLSNQILSKYTIQYIFFHKKNLNHSKRLLIKKVEIQKFTELLENNLNINSNLSFEKKIYYSILDAYTTVKKIDMNKIKKIILVEKKLYFTEFFKDFFNKEVERVIFIVRNPHAAYAGQKLYYENRTANFNKSLMIKNFYFQFLYPYFVFNKNREKFLIVRNEDLNKNINNKIEEIFKLLNIRFSEYNFKEDIYVNDKIYYGESSYLGRRDLNKKLPVGYYNIKNVEERWKAVVSQNEINLNEICLLKIFNQFSYPTILNKPHFINKIKVLLNLKIQYNFKLFLKYFLIIFFPKLFTKLILNFFIKEKFNSNNLINEKLELYE